MLLAFIVWLVMTAIPTIGGIAIFVTGGVIVCSIIGAIRKFDLNQPGLMDWTGKQLRWAIPLVVLASFLPNERTTWYMLGAYTTQTIAQSETGKELAGDGVDVLKSLMKKAKEKIDAYDVAEKPKEEAKK